MTVSRVPFSPRQWPPQPGGLLDEVEILGEGWEFTFLMAVSVNVVAAEENAFTVAIDDFFIPADYFSGRS